LITGPYLLDPILPDVTFNKHLEALSRHRMIISDQKFIWHLLTG